jgi:hypothetical protein
VSNFARQIIYLITSGVANKVGGIFRFDKNLDSDFSEFYHHYKITAESKDLNS